ncbi:MAG: cobyrinic acid a,c-diamide synthase [Lachnospiraceae bacterium]|nr:cobyrinic acid a,c-diamide synthase [Lachnospiraceae bacterium]
MRWEKEGMLHLPRVMFAAPSSGSGKTMITCGILQALCERGLHPASFKCGPDYIDPMFHSQVIGTPSRNLDTFFTDEPTTRYLFAKTAKDAGISVLEGVMGIYDGLGGSSVKASSYDLARATDTPVILIVNARGMSLSVVPLIQGYLNYQEQCDPVMACIQTAECSSTKRCDPAASCIRTAEYSQEEQCDPAQGHARSVQSGRELLSVREEKSGRRQTGQIRGVILNQTTKMTYLLLKEEIEKQTGVRLYGYVPRLDDAAVESRHLGLVTPGEIADLKTRLARLAAELEQCLDLDGILALAQEAEDYEDEILKLPQEVENYANEAMERPQSIHIRRSPAKPDIQCLNVPRIAVARDEAFCFYYQDNLDLLETLGAELVPFSPLHDALLPEGIGGLILGGGYPELYAKQLSGNDAMRTSIREAIGGGLPYLAECGGFMYLHETMEDMDGRAWPMCGCISGTSYRTQKLGRFGYIELGVNVEPCDANGAKDRSAFAAGSGFLPPGETIRAHEFHYFDSTDPGDSYIARKPMGSRSWSCVHATDHSAAGYPHLYYWSNPKFARRFVGRAAEYAVRKYT